MFETFLILITISFIYETKLQLEWKKKNLYVYCVDRNGEYNPHLQTDAKTKNVRGFVRGVMNRINLKVFLLMITENGI